MTVSTSRRPPSHASISHREEEEREPRRERKGGGATVRVRKWTGGGRALGCQNFRLLLAHRPPTYVLISHRKEEETLWAREVD